MFGYHDRLAWIDLTRGSIEVREIGSRDLGDFIGGSNLGAAILARLVDGDTDPLSPENPLIMVTGPYTATATPAGNRYVVVALSPLTGMFCESNVGGTFGRSLKLSGVDGMVFTGASPSPVQLLIDENGGLSLHSAERLWGHDVFECEDILNAEYGRVEASAVIGPAGENLVPMSCIVHNGRHSRLAGRGGMGAVMGSKNLKAIIIPKLGSQLAAVAEPKELAATFKADNQYVRETLKKWAVYGTSGSPINAERIGDLPINNWRDGGAPELAAKVTGHVMVETIQKRRSGCKRCPVMCARVVEIEEPSKYATDGVVEAPEYESFAAFGGLQLVDDLHAVVKANELCNRWGLDVLSVGGTIAMANECFEKGLLTITDTDGLELGMNRPDSNIELLRRIAYREGALGELLGKGSRGAAREIGRGAEEYAIEVKGMELPMHDPRFSWGQALSYATGNRGACHLTAQAHSFEQTLNFPELGYDTPQPIRSADGKAQFVVHLQNYMSLRDSLIFCSFSQFNNATKATHVRNWYNLITGAGLDFDAFMQLGERGYQLKRMINNRCGITRKDDTLPPRLRTLRKVRENLDFDVPPLNPMLSEYYDLRGWTDEGRPSAETIARLGLKEFISA